MTAEKLQDAIGLLPADLVAAADRLRTAPRTRVVQWKRCVSLAACLVLVLSVGLVVRWEILPRMDAKTAKTEAAPEAPMAMAPAPMENQAAADSAVSDMAVEEAAAPEAPAEVGGGIIRETPAGEDGLGIDHAHSFAEDKKEAEEIPSGYWGNQVVRITLDGVEYDLDGGDSDAVINILRSLEYDPNGVCRCMTEFTVDTETLAGIQVNLTERFARCSLGQAALTEQQVTILRDIVDNLQ